MTQEEKQILKAVILEQIANIRTAIDRNTRKIVELCNENDTLKAKLKVQEMWLNKYNGCDSTTTKKKGEE